MTSITRRFGFDAGHRVMLHESKCRNPHGHRYTAEVTCTAPELDSLGRVIDFSVIKERVGQWIDEHWDHSMILSARDHSFLKFLQESDYKVATVGTGNPTAENMAAILYTKADELLADTGVQVTRVRLYETPNCWADYP